MTKGELKDIIRECLYENGIIDINLENYFDGPSLDLESFIDESMDYDEGFGYKLRPVFIVLIYADSRFDKIAEKFVKNQKYWHAGLSFGPALSKCYSFNFGKQKTAGTNRFKGGLSFESLDFYKNECPEGTMEVSCIFLGPRKYKQLRNTLDYYIEHKEKTKYSFINLAYSLFGHKTKNGTKFNLVCSTFVDTILKSVNINLSNKDSTNLVKPDDLKVMDAKSKQFKVYEGKIKDYNFKNLIRKLNKFAQDANSNYFKK